MTTNPNPRPSHSTQQPTYGYQYGYQHGTIPAFPPTPSQAPAPVPASVPAVPASVPAYYYHPQPMHPTMTPQPVGKLPSTRGWTTMEQDVSQRNCSSYCTCYYFLSFRGILRLLQLILTIVSLSALAPATSTPSFAAANGILAVIWIWLLILLLRLFKTQTGRLEIMLNLVTDILCGVALVIVISVATAACNASSSQYVYNPYYRYYTYMSIDGWCTASGSSLPYIAGIIGTYVLFILFVISAIVQILRYRQWRPQQPVMNGYIAQV